MSDSYSIKINRQEGIVEITGEDKEWVSTKLTELKDVYTTFIPQVSRQESNPEITPIKPKVKAATKKSGVSTSSRPQKNSELDSKLSIDIKQKLASYVKERQGSFDGSLPSQAAIIAKFLQEELNWSGVDPNDMYTIYSTMGWKSPGNIRSQLNNAFSRNNYFASITNGKYVLSLKGENYASHDSLNAPEAI